MFWQNILQLLGDMMTLELIWLAADSKWIDNTKIKIQYASIWSVLISYFTYVFFFLSFMLFPVETRVGM